MLARLVMLLSIFLSLSQATLMGYVQETNLGGTLYLVNRQYPLHVQFVPDDLVAPNVKRAQGGITLKRDAATALEQLFAAALEEEGLELVAVSGYRSFGKQRSIFRRKVSGTGKVELAQLYVAPPGTSEHQLGLAIDLGRTKGRQLSERFAETDEGKWVMDNAHRFGFILRYKDEWTDITGYAYEPWHYRYVGADHAARIHALDIPLEQYVRELRVALMGEYTGEERD